MKIELQKVLPADIEKRSFEMITEELGERIIPEELAPIVKRVIHTSADFDYYENMKFSPAVAKRIAEALRAGACIVTDTQMAKAGINKKLLETFGGEVFCFMADEDVAKAAKENGTTRATASIEKAAQLDRPVIFAIGNAPTALVRIYELFSEGKLNPQAVIGVPVGFVNVVESKELILSSTMPHIVAAGRKGGSNVAAAICNAILYMMRDGQL
ncbi:precorrin-8X methylmutase [Aminipila butyrica]|uniref:Precorrin-8X methylmutase n=1 Tax=Aminipila butyrica TaxID=433296 RepID=A0A858BWK9_9FIRM|nr:precorrin-8X methylmutase [Aminipila butyrica]QIB69488.1 precorrin-8X methylmutase [Aminipila butyrica]